MDRQTGRQADRYGIDHGACPRSANSWMWQQGKALRPENRCRQVYVCADILSPRRMSGGIAKA
eukprot:scaffold183765_cov20-Prasinocladus_malaysianus.AAC.2